MAYSSYNRACAAARAASKKSGETVYVVKVANAESKYEAVKTDEDLTVFFSNSCVVAAFDFGSQVY